MPVGGGGGSGATAAQVSSISRAFAGGRPTLSTNVPVLSSDVLGSTTIYYTPYLHDQIALYDGSNWNLYTFTELSQLTTDATKSPAAVAASSCYDLFVWNDAGTIRCTRGPAWTNDTTRSAGTVLTRINGILTNSLAITNGPGANLGRYVGSVRSNPGSTMDCLFGGAASGGSPAWLGLWSMYNRIQAHVWVQDSVASYTYGIGTYQQRNNSSGNRISMMRGLDEESVSAQNSAVLIVGAGGQAVIGIGLDSVTAIAARGAIESTTSVTTTSLQIISTYMGLPGLGFHALNAIEKSGGNNTTFFGNAGNNGTFLNGLQATVRF